jgi:carboxyl-terminal processing protease
LRRVGTADPIKLEFDLAPSTFDGTPVTASRLEDRVIYVDLPGTIDADGLAGSGYATRAHEAIRQASAKPTCGWVVDLRRNWNGINEGYATLGAIIGDGKLGGFKGAKLEETYSYRQGSLYVNDKPLVTVTQPFVPADLPIAILQGPQTDWSGEAFTLAIKARANTRSFGERSYGGTSNWKMFKLSDGALMGFRIAKMIDPNGKAYNTEMLEPDQQVPLDPTLYDRPEDPMVKTALEWLKSQPACK